MRALRGISAVLGGTAILVSACVPPGKPGSAPVLPRTISHHAIGADVYDEIRLPAGRDVFVRISDANTLIYEYALDSREVVIDSAARAALRGLLAAGAVATRDMLKSEELDTVHLLGYSRAVGDFQAFADSVMTSSRQLVAFVRYSDETKSDSAIRARREGTLRDLQVAEYLTTGGLLAAHADSLWKRVEGADKPRLSSRYTAVKAVIPRIDTLHRAIQRATFGELWVQRSSTTADAAMVELAITSKLAPDYPGVRWTGKGKDVALIRAAFPRIAWTAGMAGVSRSDEAFHLEQVEDDSAKFRITQSSDSRLALIPLGLLTVQRPWGKSMLGGVSLGVGLRNGATRQLDDATDLFLMGTLGIDWLRASIGGAYTAEVHELAEGKKAGDIVDSPNALNSPRTKRRLRPSIALHMSF